MRTSVTLDDKLLQRAKEVTGVQKTPELLQAALTALVQREAARRLAKLGGSDPHAAAPPRSRPE